MRGCHATDDHRPVGSRSSAALRLGQPQLPRANAPTGNFLYDQASENYRARRIPQITNGQLAAAGELPWQVSVGHSDIPDAHSAHYCGGTIYNAHWIITAAHCIEHLTPGMVTIAAGVVKLDGSTPRFHVDKFVPAPGYVSYDRGKDIALLHLKDPITFSSLAKPIGLVDDATEAAFVNRTTQLVASGWGAEQFGGLTLSDLMKVSLPFVSQASCTVSLAYPADPATHKPVILPDMLCAGATSGKIDICDGDSGGPLAFVAGGHPMLVGVASFTAVCAVPYKYGVFAKISQFRSWIVQQTVGE